MIVNHVGVMGRRKIRGLPSTVIVNRVGVVGHRKIRGLPSTAIVNCIGVNIVSIIIIRWSGGKGNAM